MKKKFIWTLIITTVLIIGLVSACTGEPEAEDETNAETIVINPLSENVSNNKITARLYFGYLSEALLVGETRTFSAPDNESTEVSIIKQLIEGPSATRVDFAPLINQNTKLVETADDGRYLTVTLSKEFLEPYSASDDVETAPEYEQTRRYLAVYSIVNSVVEQGKYSRVRILIDEDDTGMGRPLTKAEAGIDGEGTTEPFERNGEIELNARNTMREILTATEKKDWGTLYSFIAYKNVSGQDRPSFDVFSNEVVSAKLSLQSPNIVDDVLHSDGTTNIVMVDYIIKLGDGEAGTFANVPVRLVLENDVWKITYNVFRANFLT